MTNREWLNTLSDEDFLNWLVCEVSFSYYYRETPRGDYERVWLSDPQPFSPTKYEVTLGYTGAEARLREWLKEERKTFWETPS